MNTKRTLTYTLKMEVEINGNLLDNEDMLLGVAAEIQESIPGVLCDRDSYAVLVNSTELSIVSSI